MAARLFLSHKTAEVHLSRIYEKLGVSACGVRVAPELAVLFAERAFIATGKTIAAQQVR